MSISTAGVTDKYDNLVIEKSGGYLEYRQVKRLVVSPEAGLHITADRAASLDSLSDFFEKQGYSESLTLHFSKFEISDSAPEFKGVAEMSSFGSKTPVKLELKCRGKFIASR